MAHHHGLSPRYVHCLWLMFSSQGVNGGYCIVCLWSALYKAFSFGKKNQIVNCLLIILWKHGYLIYTIMAINTLFFKVQVSLWCSVQSVPLLSHIRWCPNNMNGFFPSMILEWLFCHFISVRGIYSFFVCYFHRWKKGGRKQQHFPPKIHSTIWKYPTWSGSEIYASDAVNIFSN